MKPNYTAFWMGIIVAGVAAFWIGVVGANVFPGLHLEAAKILFDTAVPAVTVWMAWETRKMAAATRDMAELGAQPFLSFNSLDVRPINTMDPVTKVFVPSIQPLLKLENPGGVRIAYEVDEFEFTLNGMHFPSASSFDNRSGVIHPRGDTLFYHPPIPFSVPLVPGDTGTVGIRIQFWRSLDQKEILTLKLRYTIANMVPERRIEWTFLDGPTYT